MLEIVCREMSNAKKQGLATVPVSFNLSRQDFIHCDIVQEVDYIVISSGVSRDMINVEITESMIMDDPTFMKQEIKRFQDKGYQVWMDDFGSGYSSLNTLKEFTFDEIKLDMVFLSTFDERSKQIIRSVVRMAKELGLQTLAEGVETKEQYDFLRDIGCEKIQGYYLSKPQPGNELFPYLYSRDIAIEDNSRSHFYSLVGAVNMMTDRSYAIVEYDNIDFTFLYVNNAYQIVWQKIGASSLDVVNENMNHPDSPLYQQFRDLAATLDDVGAEREIVYTIRGFDVRLVAQCLAMEGTYKAFGLEIVNLSGGRELDEK